MFIINWHLYAAKNMKWEKLGQIFDLTKHKLPSGFVGFAQSPQALVFDDYIRVYFSTRAKDFNGKYLSHVVFVDYDVQFREILRVSDKPVIKLGGLGAFDEHGIFPFNVLRNGESILAYTTGWNRRLSVSTDAAIGLAVSHDNGLSFIKVGEGPVLSASLHEPFLVGDAFVKVYDGIYHMWYIHGTRWVSHIDGEPPDRVYKIAHAVSSDGVAWSKEGRKIIADVLNEDECQALPTIFKIGTRYHMYFCFRHAYDFRKNKSRGYRIGYAFSDDLVSWTRDDDSSGITVSDEGWDSEMQCYPHIFEMGGQHYMLFNGNEFGRLGFGVAKLVV